MYYICKNRSRIDRGSRIDTAKGDFLGEKFSVGLGAVFLCVRECVLVWENLGESFVFLRFSNRENVVFWV